VRVAGAGGHLRSHAKVSGQGLLATAGRQLVDVVAQLLGGHPGPGVDNRQLAHPAARVVEPCPVQIPHNPAAGVGAEGSDRVQSVDSQFAQTLKVGAFATETLQQERRVRDGELVPSVPIGHAVVGPAVALSELLWHPAW